MNKYETLYIVKPDLEDAQVEEIAKKFAKVIEDHGGLVSHAGKWDKRKLAYEIDGFKEGNYILMNFECEPTVPKELNRQMSISDDIIRYRIFRLDN
jgi:small subunit ribosomal protein S6